MTTAEKIALAKSNNYFTLFKEGLFYKCYNEDAMVFVKNVNEFQSLNYSTILTCWYF